MAPRFPIRLGGVGTGHLVPDANGDFRNSHSARTLAREAERGFSLAEYRRRNGADPFAKSLHRGPEESGSTGVDHTAKGIVAHFGTPTEEDTRTWGNQVLYQFDLTLATLDMPTPPPTTQLIHVSRRRPTSFNILTVVTLGIGWTGETAGSAWVVNINYIIGVGQTQVGFVRTISLNTPGPTGPVNGQQFFNVDQYPANAIQTNVSFTALVATNVGLKTATVSQLCAPVFE